MKETYCSKCGSTMKISSLTEVGDQVRVVSEVEATIYSGYNPITELVVPVGLIGTIKTYPITSRGGRGGWAIRFSREYLNMILDYNPELDPSEKVSAGSSFVIPGEFLEKV